uniref:Uncharacterized protein n=1 Tax=Dendroctonus ponderosae TaxID=77166 RepID=A0AAR5P492_DENPD
MPTIVPPQSPVTFNWESVRGDLAGARLEFTKDPPTVWRFSYFPDFLGFRSKIVQRIVGILYVPDQHMSIDGSQFNQGASSAPTNSYLYYIMGPLAGSSGPKDGVVVGVGTAEFCASIRDMLRSINPSVEMLITQGDLDAFVPGSAVVRFETIGADHPFCFSTKEEQMFRILEDQSYSQSTRLCTALLAMFPYIREELSKRMEIVEDHHSPEEDQTTITFMGSGHGALDPGKRLTLLAIYLLAPAYSRRERLHEQISRRAQAASIPNQMPFYDAAKTDDLINAIQWKVGSMIALVDDVLAMIICRTIDGMTNPDAKIHELASASDLVRSGAIQPLAGALLDQARLVYTNYHSTSIHFILPVFELVKESLGENYVTLQSEMTHFATIREVVANSPYMGLRSQLPDQYHIKNNAKLAYLGLLYHQGSLATEEEKASFKEYNVAGIREHISSSADRIMVENIVRVLPEHSTTALATLIQHIPLDRGQLLMSGKAKETQLEVLEILRSRPNRGPWAEEQIEAENSAYAKQLIETGVNMMKNRLNEQFEIRRSMADNLVDPMERRAKIDEAIRWRASILAMFNELAPWTDALPAATRMGQEAIKQESIKRFTTIMQKISGTSDMETDS